MIVKTPINKEKTKKSRRKYPSNRKNGHSKRFTQNGSNGRSHGKRTKSAKKQKTFSFPRIKPWKIILGAVVLGAIGIFYLNHVFATRELLQEVQKLEEKYNRAKRLNSDYRLVYDRMIGPAEIYDKAKARGFINGGPAEKVIEVEGE